MHPRHSEGGSNMFLVVSLIIGAISLIIALGVFGYSRFLVSEKESKATELKSAQDNVSEGTVEGFLRLRNRLTAASETLNNHILASQFFDVLESLTLQNVRFTALTVTVEADHSADLVLSGSAKDFNALAAQSASFASNPGIKQAIFSDIKADQRGVVSFNVTAKLDPKLILIPSNLPVGWSAPTATTTPEIATTTPPVTTATSSTATTTP